MQDTRYKGWIPPAVVLMFPCRIPLPLTINVRRARDDRFAVIGSHRRRRRLLVSSSPSLGGSWCLHTKYIAQPYTKEFSFSFQGAHVCGQRRQIGRHEQWLTQSCFGGPGTNPPVQSKYGKYGKYSTSTHAQYRTTVEGSRSILTR